MRKVSVVGWSILLLLLAALLTACGGLAGEPEIVSTRPPRVLSDEQASLTPPDVAPDLILGAQIFAENCTRCHGQTGAGDGEFVQSGQIQSIPDFTDPNATEGQSPADYYLIVTQGNLQALMPPFGGSLSDEERWSVAHYVYTLAANPVEAVAAAPAETPEADAGQIDDGQAVADANAPESADLQTGTLSGQIIQHTADAEVPADETVLLRIVDRNFSEETIEGVADADGHFEFTDVPIYLDRGYFVTVHHNDGVFNSEIMQWSPESPELTLEVPIYEITDDQAAIQIDSIVNQVDLVDDGSARIMQLISVTNTSDRIYIREAEMGRLVSLAIQLPLGAQMSPANDTERFIYSAADNLVYDTRPVLPEREHRFHLIYTLPLDGATELSQQFRYAYDGPYEVFVDDEALTVAAQNWDDLGAQAANTVTYRGLGTQLNATPGGVIGFTLQPKSAPIEINVRSLGMGFVIVGGVLVGAAALLFWRGGKGAGDQQDLIAQLAELDAQYQTGDIDQKAYERQRDRLKAQLKRLMKTSGKT